MRNELLDPRAALIRQVVAGLLMLATCAALAVLVWPQQDPVKTVRIELPPSHEGPLPTPADLLDISRDEALRVNAQRPDDVTDRLAARPFLIAVSSPALPSAAECLTSAIYYEAATEPLDGQRAVAQVVLNRVRNPAFPHSVCGVVFQGAERNTGCQFSFACDGSMARRPIPAIWAGARRVATAALGGYVFPGVGLATHYHANYVLPRWASTLDKVSTIGLHIFYRWRGDWGQPAAFAERYNGEERLALLAAAAMRANAPPLGEASADVIVPPETSQPQYVVPSAIRAPKPGSGAMQQTDSGQDRGTTLPAQQPSGVIAPDRWAIRRGENAKPQSPD